MGKRAGAAVDPEDSLRPSARADFEQYWRALLRTLPPITHWWYWMNAQLVTPTAEVARKVLWRMRWRRVQWGKARKNLGRWYFYRSLPLTYEFHWAVQRLTDQFAAELEGARSGD
jgi:hypothetical protein